ncbi:MAG: alpha/beta hydrolase [Desulfobacterales bacterium]|jgi:esterase/lipase superfamily enzyme
MKSKIPNEKPRLPKTRLGLISLLVLMMMINACSSSRRYKINLMPAPSVFEDGAVNPLPKGQPPVSYDDFRVLYATDRKPSDNPDERPFYLDKPGFIIRLGEARVKAGPEGTNWETVRRTTLAKNRSGDYPLEVVSVNGTGYLAQTYSFLTRSVPDGPSTDDRGREFARLVNERLAASGVKDVYVYLHGFRVMFDVPVLVSAELWHFMGYRGAFISYSWASTPSLFAYFADLEAAVILARKLRLFLTYLAEETRVENIHIIAFSAGSRLVVRALHQMALLSKDKTDEEIHRKLRIGNVIIIGGDISHEEFGVALADDFLRIPERTTIYISSADRALAFVSWLFHRQRLGEMWPEELPARAANFLRANPSLQFIDVTGAAGSTDGNGHSFFRKSPWVSSDLLALLAYDLGAAQRGLEKDERQTVWKFPPDFVERLQKALVDINPEWTGTKTE